MVGIVVSPKHTNLATTDEFGCKTLRHSLSVFKLYTKATIYAFVFCCQGEVGATGNAGPAGAQGAKGPAGPSGQKGQQGDRGAPVS